jgi:ABC-type nitrate/sulfonate/bicarbonate transport system substrate-binding protein
MSAGMRSRLSTVTKTSSNKSIDRLSVGFVPTLDCATLIAAKELGLFEEYDLDVQLSREVGWATIREKLLHGELDAVAAHASVLLSLLCSNGLVRRPCLTGLILSSRGSAITLSNELWELGARDAATTGAIIRNRKEVRTFIFGVVLELSTQHHLLHQWLLSAGLNPETDVHIIVIPSGLIYENFSKGFLDGYCVAEPWNSAAVKNQTGWIVSTGEETALPQPEKVLLVLEDFAEQRESVHLRLLAALITASRFCEDLSKRDELSAMLAQPCYFDVPVHYLQNVLVGPFDSGRGIKKQDALISFDAQTIGAPTQNAGHKVLDMLKSFGRTANAASLPADVIKKTFRKDIYDKATTLEQTERRRTAPKTTHSRPQTPVRTCETICP